MNNNLQFVVLVQKLPENLNKDTPIPACPCFRSESVIHFGGKGHQR